MYAGQGGAWGHYTRVGNLGARLFGGLECGLDNGLEIVYSMGRWGEGWDGLWGGLQSKVSVSHSR